MNKLILSILILAMVSSCKKETKTDELTDNSITDSVKTPESNEVSETAIPFKKIELTPDETSKMLAKKNNDTLYVTNFFATWCGPCMVEIPHFKEKMKEYIEQGVQLGWLIDRKHRCAYVYRSDGSITQFPETAILSGENIVPGFTMPLSRLI